MPFQIVRDALYSVWCDAIVNTDASAREGITPAEARDFDEIGTIAPDEYEFRRAGRPNSRYVIHTPIPDRLGSFSGPEIIRHCYRSALKIVDDFDLERVAFPLIGSEAEGCPRETALEIATEEIRRYLEDHEDTTIILSVSDKSRFRPEPALLSGLSEYLHTIEQEKQEVKSLEMRFDLADTAAFPPVRPERIDASHPREPAAPAPNAAKRSDSLFSWPRRLKENAAAPEEFAEPDLSLPYGAFEPGRGAVLDESFSQMVLRKIDELGFEKDSECYNRANIDKRVFSKIRCDEHYHPKKTTAVALAIALELSLDETQELLSKAGYSLSHSILFDLIIEYCILQKHYDIYEINELLFQYDQPLLGC